MDQNKWQKKGVLQKRDEAGMKQGMGKTGINFNEQYVKDASGETVVIRLRLEDYEKIKDVLEKMQNAQSDNNKTTVFDTIYGLALGAPLNPNPRFESDDDLWESK